MNCIFYCIFLALFSYVIMANFCDYPSKTELILFGWYLTFVLDEQRQVGNIESRNRQNFRFYMNQVTFGLKLETGGRVVTTNLMHLLIYCSESDSV